MSSQLASHLMSSQNRMERAFTDKKKLPVKYSTAMLEKQPPQNYKPDYKVRMCAEPSPSPPSEESIKQKLRQMMRKNISNKTLEQKPDTPIKSKEFYISKADNNIRKHNVHKVDQKLFSKYKPTNYEMRQKSQPQALKHAIVRANDGLKSFQIDDSVQLKPLADKQQHSRKRNKYPKERIIFVDTKQKEDLQKCAQKWVRLSENILAINDIQNAILNLKRAALSHKRKQGNARPRAQTYEHLELLCPEKQQSNSSSGFDSDLDRDDEQDDDLLKLSESASKRQKIKDNTKSTKYVISDLDIIPEASMRFEETYVFKPKPADSSKTVYSEYSNCSTDPSDSSAQRSKRVEMMKKSSFKRNSAAN